MNFFALYPHLTIGVLAFAGLCIIISMVQSIYKRSRLLQRLLPFTLGIALLSMAAFAFRAGEDYLPVAMFIGALGGLTTLFALTGKQLPAT